MIYNKLSSMKSKSKMDLTTNTNEAVPARNNDLKGLLGK